MKFDWRASSLLPGSNCVAMNDIYGLYRNNRDKWLMSYELNEYGYENNGDVTSLSNILDFERRIGPVSAVGGIDLYNHDAGFCISNDYNNQESTNALAHLGCALAGFLTLRPGGSFIGKQYTCFEPFTWNLLIIYASMFREFHICKPLTSRPGNSEIYLVGKGFLGIRNDVREVLSERIVNFDMRPFFGPASRGRFAHQINEIEKFAKTVFGQQTRAICANIKLYEEYKNSIKDLADFLREIREFRNMRWFTYYPVCPIDSREHVAADKFRA